MSKVFRYKCIYCGKPAGVMSVGGDKKPKQVIRISGICPVTHSEHVGDWIEE